MSINRLLPTMLMAGLLALSMASAQAAVKIQHWQTKGGSDVYFVENHDLPILDLSVTFAAGSARDLPAKAGLAEITRYLMTLGAGGLSDQDIANRMADVGAIMSGDLDADRASLKLRTLSSAREREQALDVYTKVLQQPDFPAAVLEREKARIIAGLREGETQPASIAGKAFMQALYRDHPYGMVAEPQSVAGIGRADLQRFYATHYGAPGAVIAIIGDLGRSDAEQLAERLTTGLPAAPAAAALPEVAYPQAAQQQDIAHPALQSHIMLGYPGVKRGDVDYFPLYVGNYILGGGGFVSRLTEEVREKRGLAYSVYSFFMPLAQLGPFQIGLQTKREQSSAALALVRETLQRFIRDGVSDKELTAAKQNITGGFPLRLDSNSKILEYLAVIGFYKLPLTYLDDFNAEVGKVTTAQIQDAFRRRVDPARMVTVVVGAPTAP